MNPTPRQESEARLGDPLCGGCHQLMDRTGFGFENYDGIGRYRMSERSHPIDGRGEIVASGDADGPFNGPRGLVPRVLGSSKFAACFVSQTAEYALGLDRKTSDACLVPTVRDRWQRAGGDLRELARRARRSARIPRTCVAGGAVAMMILGNSRRRFLARAGGLCAALPFLNDLLPSAHPQQGRCHAGLSC